MNPPDEDHGPEMLAFVLVYTIVVVLVGGGIIWEILK